MKITVDGKSIRIHGSRGVDLTIYANDDKDLDRFTISLVYDGFEHGCLPMIEVAGGRIIVQNNMDRGRNLLK